MSSHDPRHPVIVVGVDGSEAAVAALEWAVQQARTTGGSVKAVMTWQLPYAAYAMPSSTDLEEACRSRLQDVIDHLGGADAGLEITPVVMAGIPAPTLVQLSEGADLVVVGSRGHGAFSGMLLGSVSQHCVSHSSCPTVVMPDPKRHHPPAHEHKEPVP